MKSRATAEAFEIESSAVQAVMPHAGNQAFQSLGFDMERSIANARWATKRPSNPYTVPGASTNILLILVSRKNAVCQKKLSVRAIELIRAAASTPAYAKRADRQEPPYMAPSENPDDYSMVCTLGLAPPMVLTRLPSGAPFATTLRASSFSALDVESLFV